MIPPLMVPSPIHRLENLSAEWGIDLWIKRDDLIPQFMGGNKVRTAYRILGALEPNEVPDVVITNGGVNSNHCRVMALMGAQVGCEVHLVLHGKPAPPETTRGNIYLYRAAGAHTTYVEPSAIAETIAAVAARAKSRGQRILIVHGGGHGHEAVEAHASAISELPFMPDFLVHASATGGTQAGLLTGLARAGASTRVIGISAARPRERGSAEVHRLLGPDIPPEAVEFDDTFRFGGYESQTPELLDFLRRIVRREGVAFDPTYTGKAFFALDRMVTSGRIPKGARVVFWHTGGLFNLQAASAD